MSPVKIVDPVEAETNLLREIADHGLTWEVNSALPKLNDSYRTFQPLDVASLVAKGLLTVSLAAVSTERPCIVYNLTILGARAVVASFKHLGPPEMQVVDFPTPLTQMKELTPEELNAMADDIRDAFNDENHGVKNWDGDRFKPPPVDMEKQYAADHGNK